MDPVHTAFLHALNNRVHFTDVYKTLPELDFGETPMGMKYVRTARLPNGRTFVRVQEIVMPNVRVVSETQVGGEPMSERARVVGWWVPVDDTHTVGFHLEALRIENGRPVPPSLATAHPGRSTMMGEARTSYEDTQPRSRRSRSTGESTQHRASCSGAQGNNRSLGDHVPQAVAPCAA